MFPYGESISAPISVRPTTQIRSLTSSVAASRSNTNSALGTCWEPFRMSRLWDGPLGILRCVEQEQGGGCEEDDEQEEWGN